MLAGVLDQFGVESSSHVTLFTDSHLVRGTLRTRQRRLTDVLNATDASFVVLEEVILEDFGARATIERADYAQVNLATILFAVAEVTVEATPELRTMKVPERALVSVPPFKIVGRIHLLPERDLHHALSDLGGRFLPVTDATYWSDSLGEARTQAPFLAVNHSRAQVLAPYRETDVWAGVTIGEGAEAGHEAGPAPEAVREADTGAEAER
jgi:hypothetical protein